MMRPTRKTSGFYRNSTSSQVSANMFDLNTILPALNFSQGDTDRLFDSYYFIVILDKYACKMLYFFKDFLVIKGWIRTNASG